MILLVASHYRQLENGLGCNNPFPFVFFFRIGEDDMIPIEQQIVWEIDEIDEHISIYGESEDLLESKKKLEKQLEELSNEKSHS